MEMHDIEFLKIYSVSEDGNTWKFWVTGVIGFELTFYTSKYLKIEIGIYDHCNGTYCDRREILNTATGFQSEDYPQFSRSFKEQAEIDALDKMFSLPAKDKSVA